MHIITLFCEIDAFFLAYEKWVFTQWLPETTPMEPRGRPRTLHPSEVMTILIAFHQSNYLTFIVKPKNKETLASPGLIDISPLWG